MQFFVKFIIQIFKKYTVGRASNLWVGAELITFTPDEDQNRLPPIYYVTQNCRVTLRMQCENLDQNITLHFNQTEQRRFSPTPLAVVT
jgi:hypothetical protein